MPVFWEGSGKASEDRTDKSLPRATVRNTYRGVGVGVCVDVQEALKKHKKRQRAEGTGWGWWDG